MSFWKNKTTFVTGATGFVGAHVARALVEQGARVVCLQRDAVRSNSLDIFDLRTRLTVIQGQLEDFALMERIINEYEVDAVFHLAAQALVGAANRSPISTFESNIRGTYSLLEACRRGDTIKRVVVASSDKAYGTHEKLPYTEDYSLNGLYPYDASKVCTDVLARSFAHTYGTPIVVTRFANIYGPGDMNMSRIIPGTIVSVLKGDDPIIRSDGTPKRDFMYVDDVARAYLMLGERIDDAKGDAFNFGSGSPVQMLDLVRRIISLAGEEGSVEPNILLKTKIAGEIDEQYLGADKAERVFGWRAEVDLDEGLKRSIAWYRDNLALVL
ncbi:MAG: NAD-dependent epimerase/dehydratase family protein [Planctomycetes bacterium]|nr:NAD-dependent epimerase/dehydratase family protein [Planctomycetota bacterium]